MGDLSVIQLDDFIPYLHKEFTINASGTIVNAKLTEATYSNNTSTYQSGRRPFSLIFVGTPDIILPQGVYQISSGTEFENAFFIVPIEKDETGVRYQAIFN